MAKRRSTVTPQLEKATKELANYVTKLQQSHPGRPEKKDPKWRELNASVKRFQQQLKAVERRESFRKAEGQAD